MPSDSIPPPPHSAGTRVGCTKSYPEPKTERVLAHLESLPGVTEETKRCIAKLLNYRVTRMRTRLPRGPSSAVLVPLFVGRSGDLYVILSRRSDALSTFAGDTALPGGKVDAQDATVEDTARREAFEEIGLPQDKERVPLLCVMEPHLAKGQMLVTPVVVLIVDHTLQPNLNTFEVTSIFAQPLVSFLSSTGPLSSGRTTDSNNPYHTFTDLTSVDGSAVRLHRFLTGREAGGIKPVFGLTASILIKTAAIGYGRTPDFEVQPPNAPTATQQIAHALLTPSGPLRVACEREGIDANEAAARLLHLSAAANMPRTIAWQKIGVQWRKLMDTDATDVSTRTNGTVRHKNGSGSGSGSGVSPLGGNARREGVQKRVEEIEKRVRGQVKNWKQAYERKERAEDGEKRKERGEKSQDAMPDMTNVEKHLDETRDMANERMEEIEDDEKLVKGRETYPKIMKQVKKQPEAARDELAAIPEESSRDGVKAGRKGIERRTGDDMTDVERWDRGMAKGGEGTRKGLEEMRRYTGKSGDGHNLQRALPRKRDAKL